MKKKLTGILLKVKHWLIRALGGYTMQSIETENYFVRSLPIQPQRYRAACFFDRSQFYAMHGADAERELYSLYMERITNQIVRDLLDQRMIQFSCEENGLGIRLQGEVYLLSPNDIALAGSFEQGPSMRSYLDGRN